MNAIERRKIATEKKLKKMREDIGKTAMADLDGLHIRSGNSLKMAVRIINVELEYGHKRYTVEPIGGSGQIKTERIELLKK